MEEFVFLGITLDQNITWNEHIAKITIKISRITGLLRKLQFFPQHVLLTIYHTLIHSHILYGLLLWGSQYERIEKLQKKAIRVVANSPYISHTTPIFKTMNILKINDLFDIQLFKLYYRIVNNRLPSYFRSFDPHVRNEEHYNLRYSTLRLPMTRREYYVQCTKYQFFKLIRETPLDVLNNVSSQSLYQFSFQLKIAKLNNYEPNCNIRNCYVCQNAE